MRAVLPPWATRKRFACARTIASEKYKVVVESLCECAVFLVVVFVFSFSLLSSFFSEGFRPGCLRDSMNIHLQITSSRLLAAACPRAQLANVMARGDGNVCTWPVKNGTRNRAYSKHDGDEQRNKHTHTATPHPSQGRQFRPTSQPTSPSRCAAEKSKSNLSRLQTRNKDHHSRACVLANKPVKSKQPREPFTEPPGRRRTRGTWGSPSR